MRGEDIVKNQRFITFYLGSNAGVASVMHEDIMRKKKMAMFLMAVMMVAMLLSGCGKKPLIVEESKEGSTEVTV